MEGRNNLILSMLKSGIKAKDIAAGLNIPITTVYSISWADRNPEAVQKRKEDLTEKRRKANEKTGTIVSEPADQPRATTQDKTSNSATFQEYTTTDTALVVVLEMYGYKVVATAQGDAKSFYRFKFSFDDTPELRETLSHYWANELRVDPLTFYSAVKAMNARVRGLSYGA